jgi:hypothetical protein
MRLQQQQQQEGTGVVSQDGLHETDEPAAKVGSSALGSTSLAATLEINGKSAAHNKVKEDDIFDTDAMQRSTNFSHVTGGNGNSTSSGAVGAGNGSSSGSGGDEEGGGDTWEEDEFNKFVGETFLEELNSNSVGNVTHGGEHGYNGTASASASSTVASTGAYLEETSVVGDNAEQLQVTFHSSHVHKLSFRSRGGELSQVNNDKARFKQFKATVNKGAKRKASSMYDASDNDLGGASSKSLSKILNPQTGKLNTALLQQQTMAVAHGAGAGDSDDDEEDNDDGSEDFSDDGEEDKDGGMDDRNG